MMDWVGWGWGLSMLEHDSNSIDSVASQPVVREAEGLDSSIITERVGEPARPWG